MNNPNKRDIPDNCALPPNRVQADASVWGESQFLPRVPSLEEIICAVEARGVDLTYPAPDSPEGRAEIDELIELSQLRDDPSARFITG